MMSSKYLMRGGWDTQPKNCLVSNYRVPAICIFRLSESWLMPNENKTMDIIETTDPIQSRGNSMDKKPPCHKTVKAGINYSGMFYCALSKRGEPKPTDSTVIRVRF